MASLLTVMAPDALVAGSDRAGGHRRPPRPADHGARPQRLIAWDPEFLREGFAVQDTLQMDRLIYEVPQGADGETAKGLLDGAYGPIIERGESDWSGPLPTPS